MNHQLHPSPLALLLRTRSLAPLALLALLGASAPTIPADAPPGLPALAQVCEGRDGWADPAPPAHIFGNTWFVGTCGITALLITSPEGHVLIDGGPAEAAPLVSANIGKLGFALKDIRWIAASHEHFDHVGALAELQRLSGAKVAALKEQAPFLRTGKNTPDDPQFGRIAGFTPVKVGKVLRSGATIRLGPLALKGTSSPSHALGSTSWTWQSCEGTTCRTVAYADSASAISADGYSFSAHPDRQKGVRRGLAAIAALPCDLLLTPHPSASNMFERFAGTEPMEQKGACRAYAENARTKFDARLERERLGTEP